MGAITDTAAAAFRDYTTDGVPASGANEPVKSEIRALFAQIEQTMGTLALGGVDVTEDTRANLNADLAHAADSVGLVYADATDANNDLYVKVGGSGTGSWTLTTILHDVIEGAAQPFVDLAEGWADAAAADAAEVAAALDALGIEYATGGDLFSFEDADGNPAAVITAQGRLLDAMGRDVVADARAGAFASLAAGAVNAPTDAAAARMLVDAGRYGDPVMFDRMIWTEKDSADINAVRMPMGVALDPDSVSDSKVCHVFACEKHGDGTVNQGGEDGIRASWREVTIDLAEQTAVAGAVSVLKQPSGWAAYHGYEGTFAGGRISQGSLAGTVEVFWFSIVPDNASFDTPGSEAYLRYATSDDDYAAQSVIIAGDDIYTQFPTVTLPTSQEGVAPTPAGWAEIPNGLANEGRRVVALWVISGGASGPMTTIYAPKDQLFSAGFTYGNLVDLSAVGFGGINEVSLVHAGDKFHAYARNDNEDFTSDHLLTDPGPVHVESVNGATGWSAPTHRAEAPIGNVQIPAVYVPDFGITIIGGSTAPAASLRTAFSYFISRDGETFLVACPDPVPSGTIGYGNFQVVHDAAGKPWLLHFYEVGTPAEWNRLSGIRVRAMLVDWMLARAEPV